jgi:hypothetical protein
MNMSDYGVKIGIKADTYATCKLNLESCQTRMKCSTFLTLLLYILLFNKKYPTEHWKLYTLSTVTPFS